MERTPGISKRQAVHNFPERKSLHTQTLGNSGGEFSGKRFVSIGARRPRSVSSFRLVHSPANRSLPNHFPNNQTRRPSDTEAEIAVPSGKQLETSLRHSPRLTACDSSRPPEKGFQRSRAHQRCPTIFGFTQLSRGDPTRCVFEESAPGFLALFQIGRAHV